MYFTLGILALKKKNVQKKKRKKEREIIIPSISWVRRVGGEGGAGGILNCNIVNKTDFSLLSWSILYRFCFVVFLPLFVLSSFLIRPFDGPTTNAGGGGGEGGGGRRTRR